MENPVVWILRIQAPEEDVENAAEMFVIFIARNAAAQIQICSDGIKMILKKIGMLQHARLDSFLAVVARLRAEPVRFPVNNIVAVLELEKEIDETPHESFHRPELQASQALGKFERQSGTTVIHKKILQLVPLQRGDRMGKFHF
jgi:hypothetical protein